jgi:hypothetical protein
MIIILLFIKLPEFLFDDVNQNVILQEVMQDSEGGDMRMIGKLEKLRGKVWK